MFSPQPFIFLYSLPLASQQASGNLCLCVYGGGYLGSETDGWRFSEGKGKERGKGTEMGTTGYTQHEHHHYTHNPLFSSRRPMTFFFAPSPCELPTSRCLRRPPGCGCGFWSSLPREGNRSEGDSRFPAIHHFSRRVDGRVSFWGVWLKPREGGGIHTAGGVASGKRGCDERDAGKKKKGGDGRESGRFQFAWQSLGRVSSSSLLPTSTHTHINGSWRREGEGGVGSFLGVCSGRAYFG